MQYLVIWYLNSLTGKWLSVGLLITFGWFKICEDIIMDA